MSARKGHGPGLPGSGMGSRRCPWGASLRWLRCDGAHCQARTRTPGPSARHGWWAGLRLQGRSGVTLSVHDETS